VDFLVTCSKTTGYCWCTDFVVCCPRKAVASPETQRAALDSNHDLDLALDLDLDVDRELDSPTATAAPATALGMVVPGTAVTAPASTTPSPPEAPNLKK
jgi:hypothetical protein